MHGDGDSAGVPALVEAIDGAPGREVSRQRPPHAPVVDDIPDRVHHDPAAVLLRAPARGGLAGRNRQPRGEQGPFTVRGIGGIHAQPAATPASTCAGRRGRADWHQGSWCIGLVSSPPSLPGAPLTFQPARPPPPRRSQTARHRLTRVQKQALSLGAPSVRPTAHALPGDASLTPNRKGPSRRSGVGTWAQPVPSQCHAGAGPPRTRLRGPAVQASAAESALTPSKAPLPPLGPGTGAQLVPFQCKRMWLPLKGFTPTPQPAVAAPMLTPSSFPETGIPGPFPLDQFLPSQWTIRGTMPNLPVAPTAHASEADTALTAFSSPVMVVTAAGGGD